MAASRRKRAVFLDRDGTIVEDIDFLTSLAELKILDGVSEAIGALRQAGFLVLVVTNQSAVARGFLSEKELEAIHASLRGELERQGALIDAIYYCPHHPTIGPPEYRLDCDCRKPKPGMILAAAKEWNVNLTDSFAIGDSLRDAQAAAASGVRPVLVRTGPNSEEAAQCPSLFWSIEDNLLAASRKILSA